MISFFLVRMLALLFCVSSIIGLELRGTEPDSSILMLPFEILCKIVEERSQQVVQHDQVQQLRRDLLALALANRQMYDLLPSLRHILEQRCQYLINNFEPYHNHNLGNDYY
ncbi:MAG TPA: hypothetical protein VHA52_04400 [Candidatus Babeliaceae bacterium]|nr:hypothetical protein [Candidatus Babeliaceae bacterium]